MTSGSLTTTSYTIEQLESNTNYTIIVIAIYIAGSTESLPIIVLTGNMVVWLLFSPLLKFYLRVLYLM